MPDIPDAVILCGGAGLRLRSITGGLPKSMATIAKRPFLELLLKQLARYEVKRVVLAVGYQEELIRRHFGEHASGVDLVYSSESVPLGTGGALRNALPLIESATPVVMNGDSYTDTNITELVSQHVRTRADASMVVVPSDDRDDMGRLSIDDRGLLREFAEKQSESKLKFTNAGIYVIGRHLIELIPDGVQISLERELFPRWLRETRSIRAFSSTSECVDIGTPERYQNAQHRLADVENHLK